MGFTGVDDPYEQPLKPEMVVKTAENTPEQIAACILDYLFNNGLIHPNNKTVQLDRVQR